MRSRSNGGVIGAYALPNQNRANGVFFIHDAAIYNTGANPIWPLASGFITSATGGTIATAAFNTNYRTHTFTANGTFSVVTGSAFVDILLVGGGGSGGQVYASTSTYDLAAAGGGAGGAVMLVTDLFVPAGTSFTVEVGLGGAATAGISGTPNPPDDATNSGKPSRVSISTNPGGYFWYAPGGGFGLSFTNQDNGVYQSSVGGGGGSYSQGGTTYAVTNRISASKASQLPGTATFQTASGGQFGRNGAGTIVSGGGGAGWTNGYGGQYDTDLSYSSAGGDAYYWVKTGYYYGGGGPGGYHTSFPVGASSTNRKSGKFSTNSQYNATSFTSTSTGGANGSTASLNYFGTGGGGGVIGTSASSAIVGQGGAGSTGTVVFCYRYR